MVSHLRRSLEEGCCRCGLFVSKKPPKQAKERGFVTARKQGNIATRQNNEMIR